MNIALVRGPSSKDINVITYGPDMSALLIADFYYGYHYGCTAPLSDHATRKNFARRIRRGTLACSAVYIEDRLAAVYGVATRIDNATSEPYLEIEFFLGDLGTHFRPVLRALVLKTYSLARMVMQSRLSLNRYSTHARVRVRGRPGWKRALASVGCDIDDDGWCSFFDPMKRAVR